MSLNPPCTSNPTNAPAPTTCTKYGPGGISPNAKTPTVNEWNLSIEQALSANTSFRVAYVGSHGDHLLLQGDGNQIIPQICTNAAGCSAGGVNVGTAAAVHAALVQPGTLYIPAVGAVGSTTAATLPNPNLAAAVQTFAYGVSSYNGLQTEITHRTSYGLQFRANYTWSRSLDDQDGYSGDTVNEGQLESIYNIRQNWGPSNVNRTHQFGASGQYELPIGRNKPFLNGVTGISDKLVSGWQVNFNVQVLSGFPFTPQIGINYSGDGNTGNPDHASLAPGADPYNLSPKAGFPSTIQWINPGTYNPATASLGANPTFILPTLGTYGNLGRDSLIGPNLRTFDFSIFKTTKFGERLSLQFRAEAFNLLNRSNFGSPSLAMFAGTASAPTNNGANAGVITSTATDPRRIQFGLKAIF